VSPEPSPRRVAVTGLAAFAPGRTAPDPAAIIANPRRLRAMHRTYQLGTAAAALALRQAGLESAAAVARAYPPERVGIAAAIPDVSPITPDLLQLLADIGPALNTAAGWRQFAELGVHQLHPFRRLSLLANLAAAHTSLLFDLQGPSFTFTSGGVAGVQTLSEAYWTLREGQADLMVCHAASSPEQEFAAAPAAEFAAAVVLEDWDQAQTRGAQPLAELTAGAGTAPAPIPASPAATLVAAVDRLAAGGRLALDALAAAPFLERSA
jgi:3-oxoacyl-(acyl-carrier-protein) synthase